MDLIFFWFSEKQKDFVRNARNSFDRICGSRQCHQCFSTLFPQFLLQKTKSSARYRIMIYRLLILFCFFADCWKFLEKNQQKWPNLWPIIGKNKWNLAWNFSWRSNFYANPVNKSPNTYYIKAELAFLNKNFQFNFFWKNRTWRCCVVSSCFVCNSNYNLNR